MKRLLDLIFVFIGVILFSPILILMVLITMICIIIEDGFPVLYSQKRLGFNQNEFEIAYMGILEEYIGKSLGGYLLSEAIKIGFQEKVERVWAHTCSLDHENAISNYKARGMRVFKNEELKRKVI